MSGKKKVSKIKKAQLLKAVASSSAIETGEPIKEIEARLKDPKGKYKHLELAH